MTDLITDAPSAAPSTRTAGLYMRISRDYTGESLGVTRQEEDCRALALRLGWTVDEIYVDNDISASGRKPRPAYKRMLADIESGRIDAIVAWHPDRLYRRAVDLGELVELVQRHRIQVATVNAGEIDLASPTGLLVAEMLAAVAMYEVRHKSERWARSWQQRREMGIVPRTGTRMYGYAPDGEIIEHEGEIVREMARRVLAGESLMSISRWLDGSGIVATRGSAWTSGNVKRYLLNPRVAGWSTLRGEIVGEGNWEPILDRDVWETIRARLESSTRAHMPRVALLGRLLFCVCGQGMITAKANGGKRTYRCPRRPGMNGCGRVSGNALPIEEMVLEFARARLDDDRVRKLIAGRQQQPSKALDELHQLDARLVELEAQLELPDVPVETLLRAITRARARRTDIEATLAARGSVPVPAKGAPWPDDLLRRRALVDLVVERVVLHPADMVGRPRIFDPTRVEITARLS